MLLLNANRLTLLSQLVDALWEDPPASAKPQLHNLISSLRRKLPFGPKDLITHAAGYELRIGDHQLDVAEFRTLAEKGRLDEALSLWRGPALADLPGGWAARIRAALHDERLAVAEVWLDAALRAGRHDDVLRELPALIAEHPYREQLYETRMIALAGAGRRADALAVYREAYQRLVDDLGVEPGPALRDVERRILCNETVFQEALRPQPTPRQLPPPGPVLIGRDALFGEVCAELREPADPAAPMVLLVGPGGVGKTALALAVAHEVSDAFPDGQLYADLRGSQEAPVAAHRVAGRFLRALGVAGASVPDDPDERIALYRSHLAGRRILVVLDDAAREQQVRPLLPGATGRALITSRRQLTALVQAVRRTVPVLTPAAAATLLATVSGAERVSRAPAVAGEIVGLCGCLPLAVSVAAARLAVRPEWTLEDFRLRLSQERQRLDELVAGDLDVRASIGLSYRLLDTLPRSLFRRLGLIAAPDWPAWVAEELVGDQAVARLLDELSDIHLIEPRGRDAVGQLRYRLHDLVADVARELVLAEEPEPERTAAVTRVLSGWLARATVADERVEHGMVVAAGLPTPPGPAPGIETAPAQWFETERVNLIAAVEQACRVGAADLAGPLALRLAGFLAVRSYDDDREHTLRQAIPLARGHDDRLLLRLLNALFAVFVQRDKYAELPALVSEELAVAERLQDQRGVVFALIHAARPARMLGRLDEAVGRLEQALDAARRSRDAGELVPRALSSLASVHTERGRSAAALPLLEEAIAIVRATPNRRPLAILLHGYGVALTEVDRLGEAERALAEAARSVREIADERGLARIEHAQADLDMRFGRWTAASSRLDQSLRVARKVGDLEGIAGVLRSLADLAAGQGKPEAAADPLRRSLAIWRQLGNRPEQARTLGRLVQVLCAAGDLRAAGAVRLECQSILADLGLDQTCLRLSPFLPAKRVVSKV